MLLFALGMVLAAAAFLLAVVVFAFLVLMMVRSLTRPAAGLVFPPGIVRFHFEGADQAGVDGFDVEKITKSGPTTTPLVEITTPGLPEIRHGGILDLQQPTVVIPTR
jgi:hypothetical protein